MLACDILDNFILVVHLHIGLLYLTLACLHSLLTIRKVQMERTCWVVLTQSNVTHVEGRLQLSQQWLVALLRLLFLMRLFISSCLLSSLDLFGLWLFHFLCILCLWVIVEHLDVLIRINLLGIPLMWTLCICLSPCIVDLSYILLLISIICRHVKVEDDILLYVLFDWDVLVVTLIDCSDLLTVIIHIGFTRLPRVTRVLGSIVSMVWGLALRILLWSLMILYINWVLTNWVLVWWNWVSFLFLFLYFVWLFNVVLHFILDHLLIWFILNQKGIVCFKLLLIKELFILLQIVHLIDYLLLQVNEFKLLAQRWKLFSAHWLSVQALIGVHESLELDDALNNFVHFLLLLDRKTPVCY